MVHLLTRIEEYSNLKGSSANYVFYKGLFKVGKYDYSSILTTNLKLIYNLNFLKRTGQPKDANIVHVESDFKVLST